MVDDVATHLGTVRVYEAHYMLAKPLADFDAGATLIYQYDPAGGWGLKEVGISDPVLRTLHTDRMLGEWLGTYTIGTYHIPNIGGTRSFALEITDIGNNGEATAIFHDRTAEPYSIPMSGYFNAGNDLRLSIRSDGGDHPLISRAAYSADRDLNSGLRGYLNMETSTLETGWGDQGKQSGTYYYEFNITKAD